MTEDELREIEDRLKKITQGQWRACQDGKCICGQVWSIDADTIVSMPADFDMCDVVLLDEQKRLNGIFIAHAPEDMRKLFAELRRLRVGYDELTQKHDHLVEKYSKLSVDYSQARHALDVVSGLSLGQDLP